MLVKISSDPNAEDKRNRDVTW